MGIKNILKEDNPKQYIINVLIHKLTNGITDPSSFSYKLASKYFNNYNDVDSLKDFVKSASTFFNSGAFSKFNSSKITSKGNAVIFLLKGHFAINNLHNYIIGCILKELGYHVHLITCNGNIERCGNSQEEFEFRNPPYACKVCNDVTSVFDRTGFTVVSLNDFILKNEEQEVALFMNDQLKSEDIRKQFSFNKNEILKYASPYLLRYYHGKFDFANLPETHLHIRSAARYMLRLNSLLNKLQPTIACVYHGIYFPEYLITKELEKRKISYLCTEKGMKKESIAITYNTPTVHFNIPELWNVTKEKIGDKEIEKAKNYLNSRMVNNEDPAGIKRNINIGDTKKYDELAQTPYLIFFAPVIHDTVSMEKDNELGGARENILHLCHKAIRNKERLVIRCHPDELAPINPSFYTVKQLLTDNDAIDSEYIVCLESTETWNGYELAQKAKAVIIYNGTLAMELAASGHKVFNLARSHYSQKGFTEDINTVDDFEKIFSIKKNTGNTVDERLAAIKYLYYYAFVLCIDVGFLIKEPSPFNYQMTETIHLAENQTKQLEKLFDRIRWFSQ